MASAAKPGGPKKLTITLKKAVELPEDFESTRWALLQQFITSLHSLQDDHHAAAAAVASSGSRGHSYEELYGAVQELCLHKRGTALYDRVQAACADNAAAVVRRLGARTQSAAAFLAAVEKQWNTYCSQLSLLRAVFLYLDRAHVPTAPGLKPLWELGLALLAAELRAAHGGVGISTHSSGSGGGGGGVSDVLAHVVSSFLAQLDADRRGETVDAPVLASVSRMLTALRLYSGELEPLLLLASSSFYELQSAEHMGSMDTAAYCAYAEGALRAEAERAAGYMDAATAKPLVATVEAKVLSAHIADLIDRGFGGLMDQLRIGDLRRLYALCVRVGRGEDVRKAFSKYATERGKALVGTEDNEEKDKVLVQSLLDFRDAMSRVVAEAFGGSDLFTASLRGSLDVACNVRDNRMAELVAKYCDAKLRAGTKGAAAASAGGAGAGAGAGAATAGGGGGGGTSEQELEAVLDKVMALFRCVHVKDVFEAFYKKDLAKRLLLARSASMDMEKGMVARLKTECGSQFTSKLEGMFKDVELSEELRAQFLSSPAAASKPAHIDMTAHVLTASNWPTYPPMAVAVPPDLAAAAAAFEKFYDVKYNKNRRLQWQHSLGHCVLKAAFPSGKREFDVSTFQAMVLLRFNEAEAVPFTELKAATNIEDGELRRTLQSLACGHVRPLRKEPKGKDVEDGDVFHYNTTFTAQMFRIKINQIQVKETKQEADATNEQVLQQRQYQMDAAIVRIMKSRKTLSHTALMAEVFAQLRFSGKAADVKKRIENLIDRDYMERDEEDAALYHYVA